LSNPDLIQRFIFSDSQIRGELVGLEKSYHEATSRHDYPEEIKRLLGQFLAASALLSTTIKFKGSLVLQVKANGCLKLLMAECTNQKYLRAIARYEEEQINDDRLIKEGQLAITIEPESGKRYQGIVEIRDSNSLAETLENYFHHSEQIATCVKLSADNTVAAGLLLQKLPEREDKEIISTDDKDLWEHVCHLAETLKDKELLTDDNEQLLHKLFHQESVRIFDPSPLKFKCSCSMQRSANAILSLGHDEAKDILEQEGFISIDCQFCFTSYEFDQTEVDRLFSGAVH
jgi:molecular chaperone Hsp33